MPRRTAKRKRAADDKTTDEWREEDHDGTTITTSSASTTTTTTCHGSEEASGGEDGAEHTQPQTRHQQTAARKRQRTTTSSSSSSGEEHHQEPMMDSSGPGLATGKQLLTTTKRRRRDASPFGTLVMIDGGGGATHGQFASAEDLNQVDDEIDVDHQQQRPAHHMHHNHHQHQDDSDEAEEAMIMTGRAKKAKPSSAAEAGLISPMRAFADAEAAAAAAAAAGGPLGSFVVLPVEIMLHLLSFLSGKDVGHIRLTSSEFNRLGKDPTLWRAICLREFAPIPNRLFQEPFGKTWEWLYRSKAVVHNSKDSIKDGEVCCYRTKECRYEGEWKEKELDGYGIELWSDGEEYEGWSTQGRLNGYGRASYTSGDTYIGMWKNGLRDGGIYVWSDGWRYEGEYSDGKLTGRGTLLFKNGSKFTGHWLDGERHGQGTMMYFDGSRYEGEWKHDKREGRGVLYWPTSPPANPAQQSPSSSSSPSSTSTSTSPPYTPYAAASFGSSQRSSFSAPPSSSTPRSGLGDASSSSVEAKHVRYEGFWRDDQILEGGKVLWDDGAELSLEEALKRLSMEASRMHASVVVLTVLVLFGGWAAVAGSVEMCGCPIPPYYGVVPRFEKDTSALCGAVLYAPPELNALSQGIKAGCAQLAATELRGTLTRIAELAATAQELVNSTLLPNGQQGLALKRQWDATSDSAQRAALEAEWSSLFNETVQVSAALVNAVDGYTQTMRQLRQNLTTAAVADFASGGLDACSRVNHSQTQLESELSYWEGVLKNCSAVPEVCTQAKEHIANVTARMDALAPSVRFCAAFAPGLAQAYRGYQAVDSDLQQLTNGLALGLQNPLQYVATMLQRTCTTLSSDTFLLGMIAVLSNLNENIHADIPLHDICVIEAVPC